jgi:20S proteasome alpha/beta subunit
MAITVGIKCREGLVVASDSQPTWGSAKRTDTNKVSLVEFDGGATLVAESGTASLSGVALRLFEKKGI